MEFSVLMSVYAKADAGQLRVCLESLQAQTVKMNELVLVEDGPISTAMKDTIDSFREALNIQSVKLEKNVGLASALNAGLDHCAHEWVARMDADDICDPRRFEKQIGAIKTNQNLDLVGTWVEERDTGMSKVLAIRKTPISQSEIQEFAHSRSPVSHPTVMFKKSTVRAAGGYPDIYPEDYLLWCLMLHTGARFHNIPETLVWMRTEEDFYKRRGYRFLKGELRSYHKLWQIGFLSTAQFVRNSVQRTVIRLSPAPIKKLLYQKLRK